MSQNAFYVTVCDVWFTEVSLLLTRMFSQSTTGLPWKLPTSTLGNKTLTNFVPGTQKLQYHRHKFPFHELNFCNPADLACANDHAELRSCVTPRRARRRPNSLASGLEELRPKTQREETPPRVQPGSDQRSPRGQSADHMGKPFKDVW